MSPNDRMAQLYPQALGSLFIAFDASQDYGGGIITCLHTGSYKQDFSFSNMKSLPEGYEAWTVLGLLGVGWYGLVFFAC
jgi:hypothetical protein